jgi:hypothetical protein
MTGRGHDGQRKSVAGRLAVDGSNVATNSRRVYLARLPIYRAQGTLNASSFVSASSFSDSTTARGMSVFAVLPERCGSTR